MVIEIKNESREIKHLLEVINELSISSNESINREIDNFTKSLEEKFLKNKKSKWASFAENVHKDNLLNNKSEEIVNLSKRFRESFFLKIEVAKYLLDTNIISYLDDGNSPYFQNIMNKFQLLNDEDELFISILSIK